MARILLFNKPYLVLCQFTDPSGRPNLADFIPIKDIYAAGRLDFDSEGLVVLTDSGPLQHAITDPHYKLDKVYWVQVEGVPTAGPLKMLERGVRLKNDLTAPAEARLIPEPPLWPRTPPIRFRQNIPTSWLEIRLREGRKRQVRRMTAAVGYPTLRLVRVAIGEWELGSLQPGEWKKVEDTSGRIHKEHE